MFRFLNSELNYRFIIFIIILGKFYEEFFYVVVLVWCVLCLREVEGIREQEYYMDRGVCGLAIQGKD